MSYTAHCKIKANLKFFNITNSKFNTLQMPRNKDNQVVN